MVSAETGKLAEYLDDRIEDLSEIFDNIKEYLPEENKNLTFKDFSSNIKKITETYLIEDLNVGFQHMFVGYNESK